MVIGVDTRCQTCGTPVRSCVLPAYCYTCDPAFKSLREMVKKAEAELAENPKPKKGLVMTPKEYQTEASRTECNQTLARLRMLGEHGADLTPIRVNHAVIGAVGELGEIAQILENWIYYGKGFDGAAIREEIGDTLWYIALACTALGIDMGILMNENLAKLKARFPEAYSDEAADRANRDREKERAAMVMAGSFPDPAKLGTLYPSVESEIFPDNAPNKWNDPDTPPGDRSGS